MNIDPNTGMPALPSGDFWRVENNHAGHLSVQWRRKTRFGSTEVESRTVPMYDWGSENLEHATTGELQRRILEAAKRIMTETERYLRQSVTAAQLTGDYPPKKLGG